MEFTCFSKLPTELRLAIWRECTPNRIMELDCQNDDLIWQTTPCKTNQRPTNNRAPPLITRACLEARTVAFKSGRICQNKDAGGFDFNNYTLQDAWLDPLRDSVHLNWELFVDIDLGGPLSTLLTHVACTISQQASIMLGFLQTMHFRENPDEPLDHYRWTPSELADLMRTKDCWTVVVLEPVIVHTDKVTACPLFGVLGDARVHIVHVDDTGRLDQFLEFEKNPDVMFAAGFAPEDLVTAKK